MDEGVKICQYTSQLKNAKFGNCLKKVIAGKTDFKSKSKHVKNQPEDLWICIKSYKVGNFEQIKTFVNLPKNKKNSIVVNPIKEKIW